VTWYWDVYSRDGLVYESARIRDYSEGYAKVLGYWLFYRSFGELGTNGTVLCIHGGPGSGQGGMARMAKFCEDGYRVVMYDQLGAGRSDRPTSELLYSMERYAEEIEGIRQVLDLGKVHLWGGSFGAFLNVGYAVKYSKNLLSLMPSSGTSSCPLAIAEMMRLRNEAPGWVPETMDKYEGLRDLRNPEYLRALDYLFKKHVCNLDPLPPGLHLPSETPLEDAGFVYRLMWGASEFYPTGNSKYWDVTGQLGNIDCPTLITCGEYDEITPKNSELLQAGIRGSKLHVFEGCTHSAAREKPEEYLQVHRDFLKSLM
jgi:proline iminopeptidase